MYVPSIKLKESGAQLVADFLSNISAGKILDVATGNGNFIRTLAPIFKDYKQFIGIDCCEEEIKKARKSTKNINVKFNISNAEQLSFQDEEFDTICIANSLHHLENIESVLTEMYRVLKYGGYFIVQENFSDGKQTRAQLSDILSHSFEADIDILKGETHYHTFTKQKIIEVIDELGFRETNQFVISRYLRCLTCEDKEICDNPKDPSLVENGINFIDQILESINNHPRIKEFIRRGKEIKEHIKEHGIAIPAIVFLVAKK